MLRRAAGPCSAVASATARATRPPGADLAAKGLEHAVTMHGDTPGPRALPGDRKAQKRRQCIWLGAAVSSGARGAVQHRRSLHFMRFCSIFRAEHEQGSVYEHRRRDRHRREE
jgi:hypothetical protein